MTIPIYETYLQVEHDLFRRSFLLFPYERKLPGEAKESVHATIEIGVRNLELSHEARELEEDFPTQQTLRSKEG